MISFLTLHIKSVIILFFPYMFADNLEHCFNYLNPETSPDGLVNHSSRKELHVLQHQQANTSSVFVSCLQLAFGVRSKNIW